MNKGIKLNMDDYKTRKRGKCALTEQEKLARLYAMADRLHVQIGIERNRYERDPRLLSEES